FFFLKIGGFSGVGFTAGFKRGGRGGGKMQKNPRRDYAECGSFHAHSNYSEKVRRLRNNFTVLQQTSQINGV
ncbi:hypothetical protein, partial [Franconibacter helveticus]|uniref:hypothetical protein n=1 Tax=Franconibacter helveticus TaxID=357240 RepID=UPI0004A37CA4